MARRTFFFLVTVVAVWIARGVWDWNPDLRERVGDHPWQSMALLVLVVASVALLVWGVVRPSSLKVISAFVLGLAAAAWGRELLDGIGWTQIGVLALCLVALAALWAFTVLDAADGLVTRARERFASLPTPTVP